MKKITIIVLALMLIAFTIGIAISSENPNIAKTESFEGKVMKVDAAAGKIVIMIKGKEESLTGEPKTLGKAKTGDMVQGLWIEKNYNLKVIKSIKVIKALPVDQPATPTANPDAK
jgi:hypothetical protein